MQKLLFITPHLSTGGLPQYLVKQLEVLIGKYDLYVIMYNDVGGEQFVVQKNRVKAIINENKYFTLHEDKHEIMEMIRRINPDIIHMEEFPEMFMDDEVTKKIYAKGRKYKIIETSHDSGFSERIKHDNSLKRFRPDGFAFISDFHPNIYKDWGIPYSITEYPIEKKQRPSREEGLRKLGLDPNYQHVLNVGLFTSRKNQAELFRIASGLTNEKIQFHFVGNQAVNFESYWAPLMQNKPENCIVWGERSDVDSFYSCMDAFYFASKGSEGDYETNPIVLKEALSWQIPVLLRNLKVYCGMYDNWPVTFLDFEDTEENKKRLLDVLGVAPKEEQGEIFFETSFEGEGKNKLNIHCNKKISLECCIKEIDTEIPLYKTSFDFTPGAWWWLVPFRHASLPIEDYPHFNGFLLEFRKEGKLVSSHEHRLSNKKTNIPKFSIPDTGFVFFNVDEFFVQKRLDFLSLKKGGLVVDIGANFGVFSRFCLSRGAGRVLAVEANSEAFAYLQQNIKQEEGKLLHKAVYNYNGEIEFHECENSLVSGLHKDRNDMVMHGTLTTKKIECLTLDSLLENEQEVDLLKIDVEGAEYEILEACSDDTLNKCSKVYLEFHDGVSNRRRLENIKQRLLNLGFELLDEEIQSTTVEYYQGWFCWEKKTLPKRAFLSLTTENYLPVAEFLTKSISEFSDIPLLLYSVNCDIDFDYPGLIKKRIDIEGLQNPAMSNEDFVSPYEEERLILGETVKKQDDSLGIVVRADQNTYKNLTLKAKIISQAIEDGLEEGIFVDADGMVMPHVEEIFSYFEEIEDYPLVGKGLFEYLIYNNRGDVYGSGQDSLEKPLMDLVGVEDRCMFYSATNFLMFNENNKKFFDECYELSLHPTIIERPDYFCPFQDETIVNVMLWKYKASKQLPLVHFNLLGEKGYENFLSVKDKGEMSFVPGDRKVTMLESEWQQVPPNKSDIKFLHGCKSPSELQKVFQKLNSKKKARIALVSLCDNGYSEMADISFPNFKAYCDIHGYDFISYKEPIDKTRSAHWSKINAVLENIENYDWIWWLDTDALIMDKNKKLEEIIDDNYSMIFTNNKDYPIPGNDDFVINGSYISNGSSFYKNDPIAIKFLEECRDLERPELKEAKDKIDVFDREQRAMRLLLRADEKYSACTKLIHERVCNSYWYSNDPTVLKGYPSWNMIDNLYKEGDFVIQFAGQLKHTRLELMKFFADEH